MKLYKFGVLVNALVLTLVLGVFVAIQFSNYLNELVINNVIKPIFGSSVYDDLLLFGINPEGWDTLEWYIPGAIVVTLLLLFIFNVLMPLAFLRKQVKKGKKISLAPHLISSVTSVITGGGLFMLLALHGLRPSIYVKRNQVLADSRYESPSSYDYVGEYVDKTSFYENYNRYDRRSQVNDLHRRIKELQRKNSILEDDYYFSDRRNARRIENLEENLVSERRRNRRGYYR